MDTLGIVESASIASGIAITDLMLKTADVELIQSSTICSGRYMIYIAGNCAAVSAAVSAAEGSQRKIRGSYVLSNVSDELVSALKKRISISEVGSLGIVECRNVSSGLNSVDKVLKSSAVHLARLVTGQGINGKSYYVITGDVASVSDAVQIAESVLGTNLIETVVLPQPHSSVIQSLLKGTYL